MHTRREVTTMQIEIRTLDKIETTCECDPDYNG